MDDLTAIVVEGGITTAEFPPLEREFDAGINYRLLFQPWIYQEAVLDDVQSSSAAATTIVASHDVVFEIATSFAVISEFKLTHQGTFELTESAAAEVAHLLAHAGNFLVTHEASGLVAIAATHDGVFAPTHQSVAGVSISLAHDDEFLITTDFRAAVPLSLSHVSTWEVSSTAIVFGEDRLLDLPPWPFEPNWQDGVLETLEWLTDVMRSPTGAEQRRALRILPRRTFEYSIALKGADRAYFDNVVSAYGSRDWYLPLWHDIHFTDADAVANSSFLICPTANEWLSVGDFVCVTDGTPRAIELGEIMLVNSSGIGLVEPLTRHWPAGTRIHPIKVARLTEQPRPRRSSDDTIISQIRFRVVERNGELAGDTDDVLYRSFPVLTDAPDESETLELGYERIMEELDNQVGIPLLYDSAALAFPIQRHAWVLKGRQEHTDFLSRMCSLKGKAKALWLPTFMHDFELVEDVAPGGTALSVVDVGFTAMGGPKESRRDIVIEMMDGTRIFRRITAATLGPSGEVIGVDQAFPAGLKVRDVFRISFLVLSRLNQDNIEISHRTDVEGVSTIAATFRSAPDLRTVQPGF